MAAGEDHRQFIILKAGATCTIGRVPHAFKVASDLNGLIPKHSIPADDIESLILRRLIQPTRRIVRYTVIRPVPERLQQSFLDDVFDKIQVVEAENSRQGRDEMAVLMPEQVIDELADIRDHT